METGHTVRHFCKDDIVLWCALCQHLSVANCLAVACRIFSADIALRLAVNIFCTQATAAAVIEGLSEAFGEQLPAAGKASDQVEELAEADANPKWFPPAKQASDPGHATLL